MLQRLKAAEKAKLNYHLHWNWNQLTIRTASGPKHLVKKLSRAKFEQLTDALVKRSMAPVAKSVERCRFICFWYWRSDLVGGSTRMPRIADEVEKFFGKKSVWVNPDEVVAIGAAIQGGVLSEM
jgi:molecular chaperone DnaK